jgi:hypothetical protein
MHLQEIMISILVCMARVGKIAKAWGAIGILLNMTTLRNYLSFDQPLLMKHLIHSRPDAEFGAEGAYAFGGNT